MDCLKLGGPEYYERVFAASAVDPTDALVVDDNADCIAWAVRLGAVGVVIGDRSAEVGSAPSLAYLADSLLAEPGPGNQAPIHVHTAARG